MSVRVRLQCFLLLAFVACGPYPTTVIYQQAPPAPGAPVQPAHPAEPEEPAPPLDPAMPVIPLPGPTSLPPPAPSPLRGPPSAPAPNARSSSVPRLATSEQEARGCTTAADCVITCAVDGDCCSTPCGCSNALNREFAKRLEANRGQVCRKQFSCPPVGCAMEHYSASCVEGLCRAQRGIGAF